MAATPAPTRAVFLGRHPEFAGAPEAQVNQALTDAARRVNSDVYQTADLAELAACYRAAITLCRSPIGRKMRTENPDQVFTWEYELSQLQTSAAFGLRCF